MRYKNNPLQIPFSQSQVFAHQISPFQGHCRFDSMFYGFRAFAIICKRLSVRKFVSIRDILFRYLYFGLKCSYVVNDPYNDNFLSVCNFVINKMNDIVVSDAFEESDVFQYDLFYHLVSVDDYSRLSVSLAWWLNGEFDSDWILSARQAFESVFCIELNSNFDTSSWLVPLGETSKGI